MDDLHKQQLVDDTFASCCVDVHSVRRVITWVYSVLILRCSVIVEGKPAHADGQVNGHTNPTFLLKKQDLVKKKKKPSQVLPWWCDCNEMFWLHESNLILLFALSLMWSLLPIQAHLAHLGPDILLCVRQWDLLPYPRMLQNRKSRCHSLRSGL